MRRVLVLLAICTAAISAAQEHIRDVIYMKSGGAAFTMDVYKPKTPNGAAVIWMVSGGWVSLHDQINDGLAQYFNAQGFTLIEVVHGSQPRYAIPEIVKQVRRAVRFAHAKAKEYGYDPNKIGVSGGSAGGHLSLMIAGMGDDGDPSATDPIERESSRVNSVAAFFPPTDFLNYGKADYMPFDAPQMQVFIPAFGVTKSTTKEKLIEVAKETSPITYVNAKFPPTLLLHGNQDTLVPLQQSQLFDAALGKQGIKHELVVAKGFGHDGKLVMNQALKVLTWFKETLLGKP